jgi:nitric oxide dioxygenase
MLSSAIDAMPDREIIFIHGSLNEATQAFKKVINDLAAQHKNLKTHYRYSNPTNNDISLGSKADKGFIDATLIESMVPQRDADYYFCGPQPFMVNIYHELLAWGIPASQVHFEFFGPRQELDTPKEKKKCPF